MSVSDYLKETRAEMKHVSWPTRKQTAQFTLAVIGVSVATSFVLFAFDQLFIFLIKTFVLQS